MSKVYDFIKECGTFFVLTSKNNCPMGRPFGAIMEIENDLYVATSDVKAVYNQIKENENVQIVAIKSGTRDWIRVIGKAVECTDIDIKEKMLNECPVLKNHYSSADAEHYNIFKISVMGSEIK